MKLFSALLCAVLLILTGCESSSSSSNDSSKEIESMGVVTGVSRFGIESGDLAFYDLNNNKRVVFTTSTTAFKVRDSNSGMERIDQRGISIGDLLIFRYKKGDVDYSVNPNLYRASHIEVYPNGMNPSNSEPLVINTNGCNACGN